jgi:hypothetical protein
MPTNCVGINSEEITKCEAKFENFDFSDARNPKASLTLKIENEFLIRIDSFSTTGLLMYFSARDKSDKTKTFYQSILNTNLEGAEVGTRTHISQVAFVGDDKGENLKLVAVIVEPAVVTKISPSFDKSYCETASLKPDRPENLSWAVSTREVLPKLDRLSQIGNPSSISCNPKGL